MLQSLKPNRESVADDVAWALADPNGPCKTCGHAVTMVREWYKEDTNCIERELVCDKCSKLKFRETYDAVTGRPRPIHYEYTPGDIHD
jgi:hypothetical protein